MKQILFRSTALAVIVSFAIGGVGCMTSYDAYGNPQQTVDPAVAVAGAAAAGVIGYAIAQDNSRDRRSYNRYHHSYHPRHHHYPRRGHYRR